MYFWHLGLYEKNCISERKNYRAEGNLQAKLHVKRCRFRSEVLSLSTHSGLKKKDVGCLLFE